MVANAKKENVINDNKLKYNKSYQKVINKMK